MSASAEPSNAELLEAINLLRAELRNLREDVLTAARNVAALAVGRAQAHQSAAARVEKFAAEITVLAHSDAMSGRPARGRAGRIARKMPGKLSEKQIQRYLKKFSDKLSSVSNSACSNSARSAGGR